MTETRTSDHDTGLHRLPDRACVYDGLQDQLLRKPGFDGEAIILLSELFEGAHQGR